MANDNNSANKKNAPQKSFFQQFFEKIFGGGDSKSKKLRAIARGISKSKFKFYKPSSCEVLPSLGKTFFFLYKTVGPVQGMFKNTAASKVIKSVVIDMALTTEQRAIVDSLQEEVLLKRAETEPMNKLIEETKEALRVLSVEFTSEKTAKIDKIYSHLISFVNFANFDFFFLLKKLAPTMVENNFSAPPHFEVGRGEHIVDDLRDFVAIAYGLPLECDWQAVFQVLKAYKGIDPVQPQAWNKVLSIVKELKSSGILELMIRHISENPQETIQYDVVSEKVVDSWLQKTSSQVDLVLQKFQSEKRNNKIQELTQSLFGTGVVVRMKNYTEKANASFEQKMIAGFSYIEPINFLKAFLLDFVKKDVKTLADLFLIRGRWVEQSASNEFSACFHSLMEVSDKLIAFDDDLADDSPLGSKLRTSLARMDRERDFARILRQQLKIINEKAENLLMVATHNLVLVDKTLKTLLEDFLKPHHEMILNWKEIDTNAEPNVKEQVSFVYKKIYNFVMLMQYYIKKE